MRQQTLRLQLIESSQQLYRQTASCGLFQQFHGLKVVFIDAVWLKVRTFSQPVNYDLFIYLFICLFIRVVGGCKSSCIDPPPPFWRSGSAWQESFPLKAPRPRSPQGHLNVKESSMETANGFSKSLR